MAKLFIEKLKCVRKTDDPGNNDEVYMEMKTDGLEGRLPDKGEWEMSDGDTRDIQREYSFLADFFVGVFESDTGNDDTIGEYTFQVNKQPPASPLILTGESSRYELSFRYTA
ncbi:MAG: hypothetical protein QOF89_3994 [Acidobacteriota bacterium]|jgi:hypothetical protein|nr:hypothetical protein [Acidobacteriota bacterium]